ncbi:hypothetical protein B0H17DRAFT_1199299 [Mycena rosella]|uniref:Uncharacterized protein n=1 Tax=Mycena rosella TaxID=1033263 RepID=A0AAD7DN13_MYCRO|nr:hypothetical protein B0H17DRAFT_1199299 [Mycena rosella]
MSPSFLDTPVGRSDRASKLREFMPPVTRAPTPPERVKRDAFFFASIHRIAHPTYAPSEEDVLRAPVKNTAISVEHLDTYLFFAGSALYIYIDGKWNPAFRRLSFVGSWDVDATELG